MKILFLAPYPLGEAPSQRFRFEQYFFLLEQNGYTYRVQSFLNSQNWQLFYKSGKPIAKAWALVSGFLKRFFMLFTAPFFDFIFVHREAAPVGPPIIEWVLAKCLRRRLIYDFDDAIWLTDQEAEPRLFQIIKCRSKVSSICRWAYRVSCGNGYLCTYAKRFNNNVFYNPTTIDTQNLPDHTLLANKFSSAEIIIGWTGSHSTLKYLETIRDALGNLEKRFPTLKILVIANQKPTLALRCLEFIQWRKETEVDDLLKMDIGIMPLPDDEWTKGKCGFKALQYMALGIPTVASPVGVNTTIITNGENGLLASSLEEWEKMLSQLVENKTLREKIGKAGKTTVVDHFSVLSNRATFTSLFQ
jgi:glycosyltransferase involved in cell wall biosynthesis